MSSPEMPGWIIAGIAATLGMSILAAPAAHADILLGNFQTQGACESYAQSLLYEPGTGWKCEDYSGNPYWRLWKTGV